MIGTDEVKTDKNNHSKMLSTSLGSSLSTFEWYKNIIVYLKYGRFLVGMSSNERRLLKMKANQYVLFFEVLFRRNFDGILLRCINFLKGQKVLQ
jgi:hypothetical protein